MVTAADAANLYLAFQARFSTDRWTQPLGLTAHRDALHAIELDASTYPSTFQYHNDGIDDYLAGLSEVEAAILSCKDLGKLADLVAIQLRRERFAMTATQSREDRIFAATQRELNGVPPETLIRRAIESLNSHRPTTNSDSGVRVSADELAARMRHAFAAYDLSGWYVELEENMAAKASVNGPMNRVRLRRGEFFSTFDADRLMAHEIGGHVLRWVNSQRQPESWATVPMGRTIPTEEGLAICRELEFGLLDEKTIRKYQVRCLAVSVAAQHGIMEVIRAISPYVTRSDAVEIAIRTKRGLLDPNAPGGETKDWGYYDGYLRVRQLRDSRPTDFRLLCSVKWPMEELPLIRELAGEGRLTAPALIPDPEKLSLARA